MKFVCHIFWRMMSEASIVAKNPQTLTGGCLECPEGVTCDSFAANGGADQTRRRGWTLGAMHLTRRVIICNEGCTVRLNLCRIYLHESKSPCVGPDPGKGGGQGGGVLGSQWLDGATTVRGGDAFEQLRLQSDEYVVRIKTWRRIRRGDFELEKCTDRMLWMTGRTARRARTSELIVC